MKKVALLAVGALLVFWAQGALAGDRSATIKSRIVESISGFLSKSDYVVLVTRTDFSAPTAAGVKVALKSLPGLTVGLDNQGNPIPRGDDGEYYAGPIQITVLLDQSVHPKTFSFIKEHLAELAGGLSDEDSYQVQSAKLRQAVSEQKPMIIVNNLPAAKDKGATGGLPVDETSNGLKFLGLLLAGFGILTILASSFGSSRRKGETDAFAPKMSIETPPSARKYPQAVNEDSLLALADFDEWTLALWLIKKLSQQGDAQLQAVLNALPNDLQKKVFILLPSWLIEEVVTKGEEISHVAVNRPLLIAELSSIQRSTKTNTDARCRFFIQWLPKKPVQSLMNRYSVQHIPAGVHKVFLHLRPEINVPGSLESWQASKDSLAGVTSKDLESTVNFLMSDEAQIYEKAEAWMQIENLIQAQCKNFEQVDAAIEKAQQELSEVDFDKLLKKVASLEQLNKLSSDEIQRFLLLIEPQDWAWLSSRYKLDGKWDPKKYLLPLRSAMIKEAERKAAHLQWTEEQTNQASYRILSLLRTLRHTEGEERSSAA